MKIKIINFIFTYKCYINCYINAKNDNVKERGREKKKLIQLRFCFVFRPQLLDVLAAAQTEDSIEVAFQLVDFESKDIAIAERFLLCLATLPYPNEILITRTLVCLTILD